jgi:hypothetical protein
MGGVGEARGDHGGEARGLPARLHRTGALRVALVQARDGLVHLAAPCHCPTHPVEVSPLPRAEPRREMREADARPLGRGDAAQAAMARLLGAPDPPSGIDGPALQPQDLRLQEDSAVGSRAQLLGDPPAGQRVALGRPGVFEAEDKAHPVRVTGAQPGAAGRGEVGEHAAAAPGRIDV